MNKADSERIAGYLEDLGYEWAEDRTLANLVVLTTCGVRQSAEDRIYGLIPKIKKENKNTKIILTGCLSEREDVRKRLEGKVDIWLPIKELPKLSKLLKPTPSSSEEGNFDDCDYLKLNPKYNSKFSAFVPIGNGCDNFCSYCVVPYARGREVYRNAHEIIEEVKNLVKNGYKEINLIAQNVNSYSSCITNHVSQITKDSKITNRNFMNFADLLRLVNDIEGDFWIRFATSHPKDMSDELIQAIADCDKICEYIHLPAQAGDNEVLKNMNRKYTIEHYKKLIDRIRDTILGVAVSTDIIVGFPGETKEQFQNTVKLFEEIKYDLAYIAQYSPRYGTKAAKMDDDVPQEEKKRREVILTEILKKTALNNNKKYIGKEVEVLIDSKSRDGFWQGKTRTYKNVRILDSSKQITDNRNLLGQFIKVKIISADVFGLEGEIL